MDKEIGRSARDCPERSVFEFVASGQKLCRVESSLANRVFEGTNARKLGRSWWKAVQDCAEVVTAEITIPDDTPVGMLFDCHLEFGRVANPIAIKTNDVFRVVE